MLKLAVECKGEAMRKCNNEIEVVDKELGNVDKELGKASNIRVNQNSLKKYLSSIVSDRASTKESSM